MNRKFQTLKALKEENELLKEVIKSFYQSSNRQLQSLKALKEKNELKKEEIKKYKFFNYGAVNK